jgi:hypothetical protein
VVKVATSSSPRKSTVVTVTVPSFTTYHLVEGLAAVRGVEEAGDPRQGGPELPRQTAPRPAGSGESLVGLVRQLVEQFLPRRRRGGR